MEPSNPKPTFHDRLNSLKAWIRTHRIQSIVIGGIVGVLLVSGIAYAAWALTAPDTLANAPYKIKPKPKYYSPLTGLLVKSEAATKRPVTAIMIENSPDARPQSGLKQAEVVYEAVAEAGITRFVALYQQSKPQLIGPVRSVRLYYVDWLTPYNASVAHIGGSAKALQLVRNGKYRDIDQFFNADYYWRASDRYAPHNVYTSFAKLDALNKAKGYKTSNPKPFERADVPVPKKKDAKTVSLNISSPSFNVKYIYSPKSMVYKRYLGGAPHVDREKGQITTKVVVALRVNMQTVLEDGYRESIITTGSGKAVIFQNGKAYKVTWRKATRNSQLSFYNPDKTPFKLARGTTWISAVPVGSGDVSWK